MKSWKKLWKEELDNVAPDLRQDVLNAPIPVEEPIYSSGGAAVRAKRTAGVLAAVFAVALIALLMCLLFIKHTDTNSYVFTLEINPAVTVSTDADGKVTGVMSSNADGDVILAATDDGAELLGMDINYAVTWYADKAAMLGYLDISESGSAMRISSSEGENSGVLLEGARYALEEYFINNGFYSVVVGETVGIDELKIRSGITEGKTVADLVEYILNSSSLYSGRMSEGLTEEEIRTIYESQIVDGKLYEMVCKALTENLAKIERNAEELTNIWDLHIQIMSSVQNPANHARDYWSVKKYYGDMSEDCDSFEELMNEMAQALEDYKTEYGVEITDAETLGRMFGVYSSLTFRLEDMIDNLTVDNYKTMYSQYCAMLENVGINTEGFTSLNELPVTADDYAAKIKDVLIAEYGYRKNEYAEIYDRNREKLTDYNEYVEGIIAEYGSVSEYWKAIKSQKK